MARPYSLCSNLIVKYIFGSARVDTIDFSLGILRGLIMQRETCLDSQWILAVDLLFAMVCFDGQEQDQNCT
jgi:hypothetical protein